MLISDLHRFVFLHNPKAAGTSVRSVLEKYDSTAGKFWRNFDDRVRLRDMAHMPMESVREFFPTEFEKLSLYFVFGFVREPLARYISGFNEINKQIYLGLSSGQISIENYRERLKRHTDKLLSKPCELCPFVHCIPQHLIYCIGDECHADLIMKIEDPLQFKQSLIGGIGDPAEVLFSNLLDPARRRNVKKLDYQLNELLCKDQFDALVSYYSRDFKDLGYEVPGYHS
jgi:hypothetical protein